MVIQQHGNTQLTIFTSASPDFADMLQRLGQFRVGVWEAENKKPSQVQGSEGWLDQYDQIGRHFVLTRHERIIGAARMTVH
jgi:N-acyl-L-homoserine lactone synthetase